MNVRTAAILLVLLITGLSAFSQSCSALGQNPGTAFPVCGTTTFSQNTVPVCGNTPVPGIGCANILTDKNPFWYKFTCYTSGTLGFLITPNDLGDDYDWQLYDVTGRDIMDVYKVPAIIVASNWSGESGITGASAAGTALNVCEGFGRPLFSAMPTLTAGHQYVLLVSHFTNSQSGYKLSFGGGTGSGGAGGTANITDPKQPLVEDAIAACDPTKVTLRLNKKMRCNTLAADGSDFQLMSGAATITGASAASCGNGFDMETITLTFSNPLPVGDYKIVTKTGSDGNTIGDDCGIPLPVAQEISFRVETLQPSLIDSIAPVGCAPTEFKIFFRKNIRCNSIAANGSDFIISGPAAVSVAAATGTCDGNGLATSITVRLNAPIQTGGAYQLSLVNGSDLNTLVDECGQITPVGNSVSMDLRDTVSAAFSYNMFYGCQTDTIAFVHDGRNSVNRWNWSMDDNKTSNLQAPVAYYNRFGEKRIMLVVSNGTCTDTARTTINLDNGIKARFGFPPILCPEEPAMFRDSSAGIISTWSWDFGNGFNSTVQHPSPQGYNVPALTRETKYNVRLIIGNSLGCFDTATVVMKAVSSCYIAVPSAFTPNQDGINDYLYPLNAFKATGLLFKIFNRYGQVVFETTDWNQKWDGTVKGKPQGAGTYVWTLSYTESDTGKKVSYKGTSNLIR
jgi:gliding motility-associated-like protein